MTKQHAGLCRLLDALDTMSLADTVKTKRGGDGHDPPQALLI